MAAATRCGPLTQPLLSRGGWVEAVCGLTLPGAELGLAEAPHGALCTPCAFEVGSELPDPGRFGSGPQ